MQKQLTTAIILLGITPCLQAATVTVGPSTDAWLGFMNVSERPDNGGGAVFSSGWGVSDLSVSFDDPANQLTFTPNTIGDPNEFWYRNTTGMAADPANPGGPGQEGNKDMEANLFIQNTGGLAGQTVTFEGVIDSFTLTPDHVFQVFVRDFAPDFSSSVDTFIPINAAGPFSASLATINDPNRHVQYGFQMKGENVWVTDVAPFGSVVISPVPEPSSSILGLIGALALIRRRR